MAVGPPTSGDFELRGLSDFNYRRHRRSRWAVILLGVGSVAVLWWAADTAIVIALTRSEPLSFEGAAVAVFGSLIALIFGVSVPYRFLAPPPLHLSVRTEGLRFECRRGRSRLVRWTGPQFAIQLADREGVAGVPEEAWFRLRVIGRDILYFWQPVIPVTYLTKDAMLGVLAGAQHAGLKIETFRNGILQTEPPPAPESGATVYAITRRERLP